MVPVDDWSPWRMWQVLRKPFHRLISEFTRRDLKLTAATINLDADETSLRTSSGDINGVAVACSLTDVMGDLFCLTTTKNEGAFNFMSVETLLFKTSTFPRRRKWIAKRQTEQLLQRFTFICYFLKGKRPRAPHWVSCRIKAGSIKGTRLTWS